MIAPLERRVKPRHPVSRWWGLLGFSARVAPGLAGRVAERLFFTPARGGDAGGGAVGERARAGALRRDRRAGAGAGRGGGRRPAPEVSSGAGAPRGDPAAARGGGR